MKRVLKTTIAAIMAVAVLAGCTMKENVGIKIGSDKKVSASVTIAYDKEFIDGLISMNGTSADAITEEMRWEAAKSEEDMEGFTATKVTEEGMYGYVFTKELGNIDTLSTEDSTAERVNFSDDDFFTSKMFIKDGNKYKSNMKIKMDDNSASQVSQIQQGNGTIEVKLVIELPNKAISNNANEVSEDGKTLSYDLLKTSDVDFEFSFDSAETKAKSGTSTAAATKKSNMIVYIGIGGACVVAIIAVIIVMFSKKGKVEAAPVQTITPAAPVAPVAPVAPAAPEVPAAPVAPVEPVAPAAPVMPEVPTAPAEPVVPAAPAAPETTQDTTINQ